MLCYMWCAGGRLYRMMRCTGGWMAVERFTFLMLDCSSFWPVSLVSFLHLSGLKAFCVMVGWKQFLHRCFTCQMIFLVPKACSCYLLHKPSADRWCLYSVTRLDMGAVIYYLYFEHCKARLVTPEVDWQRLPTSNVHPQKQAIPRLSR